MTTRELTASTRDTADAADPSVWIGAARGADIQGDRARAEHLRGLELVRQGKLVVSADAPMYAVEQYRRLAAVMYQAQTNRGIRTVMIASALPAEGKSLTATNLALTLSQSYRRRVLLVDADLRRPTLHDTFEIPNLAGLSDWLKDEAAGRMPLVPITPYLMLLPGGRPDSDPMSSLASDRMKRMLAVAAERFDWVIVDAPPVAMLPDGHLLSALVDTIALVVAAGRTPAATLQRVVEQLGRDRIIGVVLNRVTHRRHAYGRPSDYDHYRNGSDAADAQRV